MDIMILIEKKKNVLAHTKEGQVSETLEEHTRRVYKYFRHIKENRKLEIPLKTLASKLGDNPWFEELFLDMLSFHDIGKINLNFQLKVMKNKIEKRCCSGKADHAMLSAIIYIDYYWEKLKKSDLKPDQQGNVINLIFLNAYVISRHHSSLSSFKQFKERMLAYIKFVEEDKNLTYLLKKKISIKADRIENLCGKIEKMIYPNYKGWESSYFFIYTRFAYSILVACDFYATSEYVVGEETTDLGIFENIDLWRESFEQTSVYQGIKQYEKSRKEIKVEKTIQINDLRSEMFLEATESLKQYEDENIYYLEAPTGSGKTNTSIGLILELLEKHTELNKVFYVFPFNTLSEQTYTVLAKAFQSKKDLAEQMVVVNSITPIKNKDESENRGREEDICYEKMLLDRQFFHYPLVITSHVQLFQLLFEPSRECTGGLYQLANSILIIDEVQAYKNILWKEIIGFLNSYAELLNIKIVIMSATLPRLGELIEKEKVATLILDRDKYFKHPLFKNRVKIDFSLLEQEEVLEEITQLLIDTQVNSKGKVLVEFIKKKSAVTYYNTLKELEEKGIIRKKVLLITGDDFKWEREKIITQVKEEKEMILIATQIIEAGVDIDMDVGFKDISLLDAEEQFLGRINRSCLREGKAYFFNLDDAATIYKEDYRKQKKYTLKESENQKILIEKEFEPYYKQIMSEVSHFGEKQNENNTEQFLHKQVKVLESGAVAKRMRLIGEDVNPVSVFLGRIVEVEREGEILRLDGNTVWEVYRNLIQDKDMPYAKRKIKIAELREKMSCFIWKVRNKNFSYNEQIGELFYIEEGDKYFINGKFNREKLSQDSYEFI